MFFRRFSAACLWTASLLSLSLSPYSPPRCRFVVSRLICFKHFYQSFRRFVCVVKSFNTTLLIACKSPVTPAVSLAAAKLQACFWNFDVCGFGYFRFWLQFHIRSFSRKHAELCSSKWLCGGKWRRTLTRKALNGMKPSRVGLSSKLSCYQFRHILFLPICKGSGVRPEPAMQVSNRFSGLPPAMLAGIILVREI